MEFQVIESLGGKLKSTSSFTAKANQDFGDLLGPKVSDFRDIMKFNSANGASGGSSGENSEGGILNSVLGAIENKSPLLGSAGGAIFNNERTDVSKRFFSKPLFSMWLPTPKDVSERYSLNYTESDMQATYRALDLLEVLKTGTGTPTLKTTESLKLAGIAGFDYFLRTVPFQETVLGGNINFKEYFRNQFRKIGNPNMEYIFQRANRRNFTFTFEFYPKNEDEINQMRAMIQVFKKHSHPRFENPDSQRILVFPSVWKIKHWTKIPVTVNPSEFSPTAQNQLNRVIGKKVETSSPWTKI
jgi:hypothetical protein